MPSPSTTSVAERPRERLRQAGARHLALGELLALLVGSGSVGGSARVVAERLATRAGGSLARLAALDVGQLEAVPGVGSATACRVLAALELGRRAAAEELDPGTPVRGPDDVFRRMGPRLRDLAQEEFHALLLNTRHRVVREVLVTRGILDASLIHPREVFRPAVAEGAAGVILVHDEP
jgi:DNA repair protein RadC